MVTPDPDSLDALLVTHREEIVRMARHHGGGLLRYESAEDLAQGVQMNALKAAEHFEYQGTNPFLGWIRQLVRQHVARRHEYWSAQKRDAGAMLRVSSGDHSETGASGYHPPADLTGPATFADRREQLLLAMKALEILSEKDQQIVRWVRENRPTAEIAEDLGVSLQAAEKARTRAMERFRKTYALVSGNA